MALPVEMYLFKNPNTVIDLSLFLLTIPYGPGHLALTRLGQSAFTQWVHQAICFHSKQGSLIRRVHGTNRSQMGVGVCVRLVRVTRVTLSPLFVSESDFIPENLVLHHFSNSIRLGDGKRHARLLIHSPG